MVRTTLRIDGKGWGHSGPPRQGIAPVEVRLVMERILPAGRRSRQDARGQASSWQTGQRWRLGHWRGAIRTSASLSTMRSPERSTGDAVQGAGELERRLVVRGHRRAGVGAAAEHTEEGEGVVTGRSVSPTRCRSM